MSSDTRRPPWETIPATPELPTANTSGTASINGVDLWYGVFGVPVNKTPFPPVVFLHGGQISSRWWALQVEYLANLQTHTIIVVDSRGHGRSSDDLSKTLSYDAMAEDVLSLMDHLEIDKFTVVGWSDGGVTGLTLIIKYPQRIDRLFAFGANYDPSNSLRSGGPAYPDLGELAGRVRSEYEAINPRPDWKTFVQRVKGMQAVEPAWTAESFRDVPSLINDEDAPLVWIVGGDYEEAIKRETFGELQSFVSAKASSFDTVLVLTRATSHTHTDQRFDIAHSARGQPHGITSRPRDVQCDTEAFPRN